MQLKDYLKEKKILCDGAFGTYFSSLCKEEMLPEQANIKKPELVKQVHLNYIAAGARLIRTNTFAANKETLHCDDAELKEIIKNGCQLAREAVKESKVEEQIFIAGDIGAIPEVGILSPEKVKEEYAFICKCLLEQEIDCLVFETFSEYEQILPVIREIKREREIFILIQFGVNQHGYTGGGISAKRILSELSKVEEIDGLGFNCGVGPGHLLQILEGTAWKGDKFLSALPNASYPKMIKDRIVFLENKDYFAQKLYEIAELGADLVGGCCGTTPEYIEKASSSLNMGQGIKHFLPIGRIIERKPEQSPSAFYANKEQDEKMIAVELAPPFKADDEKILDAANYLKTHKTDAITFPDSPSGRTRADSILIGAKVMEKTGACVIPHICCRDKNAIAIRSQLLGAYMNGIRNILVITGDPIPTMLRRDIKSVYNFDSVGLMKIIQEMNEDEFLEDPIVYGGALNYNRPNMDVEIMRMEKKIQAGASFFLTQPLFTKEDADRLREVYRKKSARILCGLMPLVSQKNALFIKNEMAGIHVTEEIVNRYKNNMTREEGEAVGIKMVRDMMRETQDFVAGYYYSIPFNRVYLLDDILKK